MIKGEQVMTMKSQSRREEEAVLSFLRTKTSKPVSLKEIARNLEIPAIRFRSLRRILRSLTGAGSIYRTRSGLYGISDRMNLITGLFEGHRDGYGFVLPDRSGERDLFIPRRKTMGAMSGDRVVARVESAAKRDGAIVKILDRSRKRIIGRLCRERRSYYVVPKGKNLPFDIHIGPGDRNGARAGKLVVVELTSYPTPTRPPEGRVLKVLPEVDEPAVEIEIITEEHSLPRRFPASVLREARGLSETVSHRGRVDCRGLQTVTIDGEDAKDFDDAISIRKRDDGYLLSVHIADVSHYVRWDTALDLEARRRGTSVYFPGHVIPMLPERLSNQLCSLLPRSDRLTFTVEMLIGKDGAVRKKNFYPSVINSNERMTYTSVSRILEDHDPEERSRYGYLLGDLETMGELFSILKRERVRRGSLDFDLPEPYILLDLQGSPEAIIRAERSMSHMIIEEFMIAANEAVSSFLEEKGVPTIYRVHEEPDSAKLDELRPVLKAFGHETRKSGARAFRSVLKKTEGTAEATLINILLLRALKQAKYSPENIGHFGLASESYTHFTSPIRRYPDLVVHRILKDLVRGKGFPAKKREYLERLLPEITAHSSQTERTADEAEREIVSALRTWFMKDKVGNEYRGIVTNINSQGLKVRLHDIFVEGFVHVSSMGDDYYRFDEERYRLVGRRTKKRLALGDEITIRIERVDIEEREITFLLV
jgi:ribonuclease R